MQAFAIPNDIHECRRFFKYLWLFSTRNSSIASFLQSSGCSLVRRSIALGSPVGLLVGWLSPQKNMVVDQAHIRTRPDQTIAHYTRPSTITPYHTTGQTQQGKSNTNSVLSLVKSRVFLGCIGFYYQLTGEYSAHSDFCNVLIVYNSSILDLVTMWMTDSLRQFWFWSLRGSKELSFILDLDIDVNQSKWGFGKGSQN